MTKFNKLGKSTFLVAILSFLLVAVLAFGGTYAYFSDRADAVTGDITTGHLTIETSTGSKTGENLGQATLNAVGTIAQPNQVIFNEETVTTTVKSNIAYFTRVRFNVKLTGMDDHTHYTNENSKVDDYECEDTVTNATDILTVTIKNGSKSMAKGTAGAGLWQTGYESDAIIAGQDIIYYQLAPTLVTNGQSAGAGSYNTTDGKGTETFIFTVRVNDWVGNNGDKFDDEDWDAEGGDGVDDSYDNRAEGCDYWMDVKVEVQVIVEVLQADFLLDANGLADPNADPADPAAVAFENGVKAREAWEAALGKTQPDPTPAS